MFLQRGQVVEGIGAVQLTRMNQAHEEVADLRAVLCLVEQRIFSMQDGLLQPSKLVT